MLSHPNWFVNLTSGAESLAGRRRGQWRTDRDVLRAAFMPTVAEWDWALGFSPTGSAGRPMMRSGIDMVATKASRSTHRRRAVGSRPLGSMSRTARPPRAPRAQRRTVQLAADRSDNHHGRTGVLDAPHFTVLGGYRVADNPDAAANSGDNAVTSAQTGCSGRTSACTDLQR